MERVEAEAIYEQGRGAVVAVLMRMDEQIARLSERVARQDERIAELERRLNRNSRNSSAPPSQDPPESGDANASSGRLASKVPSPGTAAMAGGCCRRTPLTRSLSTGPSAAAAGTSSASQSASR